VIIALPPSGRVVEFRDLGEAELLVVGRTDPFGRVDGAALERRVDIAWCDLGRHGAELCQHDAAETADPHSQSLEVVDALDLLAEPAAHLHADIAAGNIDDTALEENLAQQFKAAAIIEPRRLLARIGAEGDTGIESVDRVLAEIESTERVAAFDAALLDGVEGLHRTDYFAGRKGLHLKLAVGQLGDALTHRIGRAVDRVQALRPARGHAPAHRRRALGEGRAGQRGCGNAGGGPLEKRASLHVASPL
jgi:hypothetical protein